MSISADWPQVAELLARVGVALLVLVVAFVAGRLLGRVATALLGSARLAATHQAFFRNLVALTVGLVGFGIALDIVGLGGVATGLLAGGGMAAIALGFAFRGVGENLLAGLFLAFSRPFNLGDLISCAGHEGLVRAISLRHTHIRTSEGADIFLPNAVVFGEPLTNFTKDGLRRPTFRIGVDYADDLEEACRVLRQTIAEIPGALADPAPVAVVWAFQPAYVEIEINFWINTFDGTDFARVRGAAMALGARRLLERGFTLSGDVTTRIALSGRSDPE